MGGPGVKRGSRPKPTAKKRLEGNPGRRPLNPAEPTPEGITTPPAWLDRIARQEWRRLRPRLERLGLLTAPDRAAFAAYCANYSLMVQASRALQARDGRLSYSDDNGKLVPYPEVLILRQSADLVRKLGAEFGMMPAERSRIVVPEADPKRQTEDFLFGGDGATDGCAAAAN